MGIKQVFLDKKHEEIISKYVKLWSIPMYKVIRKIIEDYETMKGGIEKDEDKTNNQKNPIA